MKTRNNIIVSSVVVLVIVLTPFVYSGFQLYTKNQVDGFSEWVVTTFPYPVISVNGDWITYREASEFLESAQVSNQYFIDTVADSTQYQHTSQISTEPAELIELLVQDKLIDQQLSEFQDVPLPEANSESSQDSHEMLSEVEFKAFYGPDSDTYYDFLTAHQARRNQLQSKLETVRPEAYYKPAEDRAQELYAQAAANPDSFAELARTYNENGTQAAAGDMGWVTEEEVSDPSAWSAITELTQPGQITRPIQAAEGYYIYQLIDTETDDSSNETEYWLRHIFISVQLEEYISNIDNNSKIQYYYRY